jgi:hypothetical protein
MTAERDLGTLLAEVAELKRRGGDWDEAIRGLVRDRWWLRGAICGGGILIGAFAKTILSHLGGG